MRWGWDAQEQGQEREQDCRLAAGERNDCLDTTRRIFSLSCLNMLWISACILRGTKEKTELWALSGSGLLGSETKLDGWQTSVCYSTRR